MKPFSWSLMIIGLAVLNLSSIPALSQTILQPGDLAVIGLGANVGGDFADCNTNAGLSSGRDLVSFVCFQDIEPGTIIDITDNGWERGQIDRWGNVEGFLRVTRTGAIIPAGTIITFEFPPAGEDYIARTPDTEWNFESLGTNALNFNSNGDQLYFLQGGTWDNGTTMGCCNGSQDAQYLGGRILFGFNTKTDWNALAEDSKDSGLHPDVIPCFHMEPTGGTTNFITYTGPVDAATQLEWIGRVSDATNWSTFNDCNDFLNSAPLPLMLPIAPNEITIECVVCQGCAGFSDTLSFLLPNTGGPFQVAYTDGTDTFMMTDITNEAQLPISVFSDAQYDVVSVTDGSGCPLYSNFRAGATVMVTDGLQFTNLIILGASCPEAADGSAELVIAGGQEPFDIQWFDSQDQVINRLTDQILVEGLPAGNYSLRVEDADGCTIAEDFTVNSGNSFPAVTCEVLEQPSFAGDDGEVRFNIIGSSPPFLIKWEGPVTDSMVAATEGEVIVRNLLSGQYTTSISGENGCASTCTFSLVSSNCNATLSCEVLNQVSTFDGADGEAQLTYGGGTPPYTIEWTGPITGSVIENFAGSIILSTLPAGTHNISLTDADGCFSNCVFEITQPTCNIGLELAIETQACDGIPSGSIISEVMGAVGEIQYNWTGVALDGQPNPTGLEAGRYTLIVIDETNCRDTASVEITTPEGISADVIAIASGCDLTQGTILVSGATGGTPPYSFSINGSAASPINSFPYSVSGYAPGSYQIEIKDSGNCAFQTEATVIEIDPPVLELGADLTIKPGDSLLIEPIANFTPTAVNWDPPAGLSTPDSLITFARPDVSTTYRITATNEAGCETEATFTIFVDRTRSIFIPSAFTPNNDGRNDLLTIFGGDDILNVVSFHVFDRWGGLVFQTDNISINNQSSGWDGTFKGQLLPAGTYVYFAEVLFSGNERVIVEGSVNLIR